MHEDEIHRILDSVEFGDRITITRSNGGQLAATVVGPVIGDNAISPAIGIDLLDGQPHVIRDEQGRVFGQVIQLDVEKGPS